MIGIILYLLIFSSSLRYLPCIDVLAPSNHSSFSRSLSIYHLSKMGQVRITPYSIGIKNLQDPHC